MCNTKASNEWQEKHRINAGEKQKHMINAGENCIQIVLQLKPNQKKNCRTNYNNKKYIPLHAEEDM